MSDHVYKHIHLTGTSSIGIEDAVARAIEKASHTIRHLRWFEVVETRGQIEKGKVTQWQTSIRVGFTLDD